MAFATRVSQTLVRPNPNGIYKGANVIYYPAQGVRSCTTSSVYQGLNTAILWVEWDSNIALDDVGGPYWQVDQAKALGCNYIRAMQDGGGSSWLKLYDSGGDYASNRAIAISRMVDFINYCASQDMYVLVTLCPEYTGYLSATNGDSSTFGPIADHAAAVAAAVKDLPNVIGMDVCQEFNNTVSLGMETHNSDGDPVSSVDASTEISSADALTLVGQIIDAVRVAAPDLALTASFSESNSVSGMWSAATVATFAGLFDFLDFHCYYDVGASTEPDALYAQTGTSGKPFLVSEVGQKFSLGTSAQSSRLAQLMQYAVLRPYSGQPGCYGFAWWAISTQGAVDTDDWGAVALDNSEPPTSSGSRPVADVIASERITYRQWVAKDFEGLTVGDAAGFANAGSATFGVRTLNPISGTKSFGESTSTDGDVAMLDAPIPPNGVTIQYTQKLVGTDGSNYSFVGPLLSEDGSGTNGYLLGAVPLAGAAVLYKKTGGTFSALGSVITIPTFSPGDVVITKFSFHEGFINFKMWLASGDEPVGFAGSRQDATYTPTNVGLRSAVAGTGGNASVDDFYMGDAGTVFPAARAALLVVSGPTSGTTGEASTDFTLEMDEGDADAVFSGTDTITLTASEGTITATAAGGSISGNGTGTVAVTPAEGEIDFTFTYSPATAGSKTIAFTNGQQWSDPDAAAYVAEAGGTTGTADITAGAATFAATGGSPFTGTASVTATAATFAASGESPFTGTASVTSGAATFLASESGIITGTVSITAAAPTFAATGESPFTGTSAFASGAATFAATVATDITGTVSITSGAATFLAAQSPTVLSQLEPLMLTLYDNGLRVGPALVGYVNSAPAWQFQVVDETGTAVDLTGKTFSFAAAHRRSLASPVFTITDITPEADDNDINSVLTIAVPDDQTEEPLTLQYAIENVTDNYPVGTGILEILDTVQSA